MALTSADQAAAVPTPTGGIDISDLRVELTGSGIDVVDDIDLTLAPGEIVGLVGESGSGKTTVGTSLLGYARAGARIGGGSPAAALAALDLAALAKLPARMLSAGQRRRLALARLTLGRGALWLLDEPTLGLDAASVARLGELLARHRAGGGVVVAATHLPLPLPGAGELRL